MSTRRDGSLIFASSLAVKSTCKPKPKTISPFFRFQDRKDIKWGQQWKERIEESIDTATFFIPIITPRFFKSPACRTECERFRDREKKLNRSDFILPVYYVNCPILDEVEKTDDPLAKVIAGRQHTDLRELRFDLFTSPLVRKMIANMATQIVKTLNIG